MNGSLHVVRVAAETQGRLAVLGRDDWGTATGLWTMFTTIVAALARQGLAALGSSGRLRGSTSAGEDVYSYATEFCSFGILHRPGFRDVRIVHAFHVDEVFTVAECERAYLRSDLPAMEWILLPEEN